VYEGGVIGEDCIIGREAIVSGGVKIWNGKSVPPGANITRNIKYGGKSGIELSDNGITGETNADITPELCTVLGAALAAVVSVDDSARSRHGCAGIAVSCENNNASAAMKHAVLAGASGAGGESFDLGYATLPQLMNAGEMLNCGIIARIKCSIFVQIEIFGKSGLPLTRLQERRLEAAMSRNEYKNADWNSFGLIHTVTGFENMYSCMLYRYAARFKSEYKVKVNYNNVYKSHSLTPVFESVSSANGEILVVTLTDGGSKAEIYTGNDKVNHERLILLAAAGFMQNGTDVALPHDFAGCADFLASSYGRKIHRYYLCSNDSSDEHARELAAGQVFLRDGAVLALNVLEFLARNSMSIENAVKAIPAFASERREVEINCPPQRIISRLCVPGCGKGEGVLLGDNRENILIRSGKRGKSLFLLAESLSSETAAELCDNAENLIKKLMTEL
jgi:phosphomannomutase